jgi:hypothetical protein
MSAAATSRPTAPFSAAFVRQSRGRTKSDTWLALSRPPYFTALALWFVGGTYYTGGFFPDRASLWAGFTDQPADEGSLPAWLNIVPPTPIPYIDGTPEWPHRTVHFNRLLRDGWKLEETAAYHSRWVRDHSSQAASLVMTQKVEGLGPYLVDYALRPDGGDELPVGRADWADWDQQGRLVLAREGRLWRWQAPDEVQEIADLNGQAPDPASAPDWARLWPPRPESR